jgi:hypothetical protein
MSKDMFEEYKLRGLLYGGSGYRTTDRSLPQFLSDKHYSHENRVQKFGKKLMAAFAGINAYVRKKRKNVGDEYIHHPLSTTFKPRDFEVLVQDGRHIHPPTAQTFNGTSFTNSTLIHRSL